MARVWADSVEKIVKKSGDSNAGPPAHSGVNPLCLPPLPAGVCGSGSGPGYTICGIHDFQRAHDGKKIKGRDRIERTKRHTHVEI